ncbi:MAG TPA: hypothetical protein VFP80_02520, partial [Thermoanaerobaculia bacterium]|nr:hypothetical protein [Thermoanaerobaculia bacterium]
MRKSLRSVSGALLLCLSTAAFAAGREAKSMREAVPQTAVAPLRYALPPLDSNDESLLEVRILRGKLEVIRTTIALPAGRYDDAIVDLFGTHGAELTKLRDQEAERPGSLRVVATLDGRALPEQPFAQVDSASAELSNAPVTGELRSVDVSASSRRPVQADVAYYDPACIEQCDQQYSTCLEWCDPRGDSCTQCDSWYTNCWTQCPIICEEPRSVSTRYETVRYSIAGPYFTSCAGSFVGASVGQRWNSVVAVYRTYAIQRTTHCNYSYS